MRITYDVAKKMKTDKVDAPSTDTSVEDLDAPLPADLSKTLWEDFLAHHKVAFGPRFQPNGATTARSVRERKKSTFTPRPLSKVGNLYQQTLTVPQKRQTAQVGPWEVAGAPKEQEDVPVRSLIDCLNRVWLLLLSFALVGMDPHRNKKGDEAPWFTLTDAYEHLEYLTTKACGGDLVNLATFQQKELHLRCNAIPFQTGPEQLSLADALRKAREGVGDLWMGLYKSTEGVNAPSSLFANPLTSGTGKRGPAGDGDLESPAKKLRQESFPGVHRPSTEKEKITPFKDPLAKNGNTIQRGPCIHQGNRVTICKKFASGKGCSTWPCGGAHACDIVPKGQSEPCLGGHPRQNCPKNK